MTDKTQPNYEELGKQLVNLYESGDFKRRKSYVPSFIKGAVSGFGAAIGGTVGITILVWVLSRFHSLPLIGHIVDTVQNSLHK